MQPRGRASEPNSSTFEVLLGEKAREVNLQILEFRSEFPILSGVGYLLYASISGLTCACKHQKITSTTLAAKFVATHFTPKLSIFSSKNHRLDSLQKKG